LKLRKRETELLMVGSILPDKWGNFPHHVGKELEIIKSILKARLQFLEKDDECFSNLGVALHYIQDMWTLRPRVRDKHTEWETLINTSPYYTYSELKHYITEVGIPTKAIKKYLKLLETIEGGVENFNAVRSNLVKGFTAKVLGFALIRRPTTWSTPIIDLNFALRISFEVAESVIMSPSKVSKIILEDLNKQKEELSRKLESFPYSYFKKHWSYRNLVEVLKRHRLPYIYLPVKYRVAVKKKGLMSIYYRINLTDDAYLDLSSEIIASYVAEFLRSKREITRNQLLRLKVPSEQDIMTILSEYEQDKKRLTEIMKYIQEEGKNDLWIRIDLLQKLIIDSWKIANEIRRTVRK